MARGCKPLRSSRFLDEPMAYDEPAADRVRALLEIREGYSERKMFGGLCFMLHGNMCCGLLGSDLMLRLGPEAAAAALDEPHVREMDFTGRAMRSMVYVDPAGYASDADLQRWLDRAAAFAATLPPKR